MALGIGLQVWKKAVQATISLPRFAGWVAKYRIHMGKNMNFCEALAAMQMGAAVRVPEGDVVTLHEGEFTDSLGRHHSFDAGLILSDQWDIMEKKDPDPDSEPTYDFGWALAAMRAGKKVHRPGWSKDVWWAYFGGHIHQCYSDGKCSLQITFEEGCLLAVDWKAYGEKLLTFAQAIEALVDGKVVRRAEWADEEGDSPVWAVRGGQLMRRGNTLSGDHWAPVRGIIETNLEAGDWEIVELK